MRSQASSDEDEEPSAPSAAPSAMSSLSAAGDSSSSSSADEKKHGFAPSLKRSSTYKDEATRGSSIDTPSAADLDSDSDAVLCAAAAACATARSPSPPAISEICTSAPAPPSDPLPFVQVPPSDDRTTRHALGPPMPCRGPEAPASSSVPVCAPTLDASGAVPAPDAPAQAQGAAAMRPPEDRPPAAEDETAARDLAVEARAKDQPTCHLTLTRSASAHDASAHTGGGVLMCASPPPPSPRRAQEEGGWQPPGGALEAAAAPQADSACSVQRDAAAASAPAGQTNGGPLVGAAPAVAGPVRAGKEEEAEAPPPRREEEEQRRSISRPASCSRSAAGIEQEREERIASSSQHLASLLEHEEEEHDARLEAEAGCAPRTQASRFAHPEVQLGDASLSSAGSPSLVPPDKEQEQGRGQLPPLNVHLPRLPSAQPSFEACAPRDRGDTLSLTASPAIPPPGHPQDTTLTPPTSLYRSKPSLGSAQLTAAAQDLQDSSSLLTDTPAALAVELHTFSRPPPAPPASPPPPRANDSRASSAAFSPSTSPSRRPSTGTCLDYGSEVSYAPPPPCAPRPAVAAHQPPSAASSGGSMHRLLRKGKEPERARADWESLPSGSGSPSSSKRKATAEEDEGAAKLARPRSWIAGMAGMLPSSSSSSQRDLADTPAASRPGAGRRGRARGKSVGALATASVPDLHAHRSDDEDVPPVSNLVLSPRAHSDRADALAALRDVEVLAAVDAQCDRHPYRQQLPPGDARHRLRALRGAAAARSLPNLGVHEDEDEAGADADEVAPHVVVPSSALRCNSARKPPPPLRVRNLDAAPRGSETPALGMAHDDPKLRMTNPWKRMDWSAAEERPAMGLEEVKTDEAVAQGTATERQASSSSAAEHAVLDMLEAMNSAVDTFDKPSTLSRFAAAPAASASPTRSQRLDSAGSRSSASTGGSTCPATPSSATLSPTRRSVRAFANALEQQNAAAASGPSPTTSAGGRTASKRSHSSFSGSSDSTARSNVRRTVQELQSRDEAGSAAGSAAAASLRVPMSRGDSESSGTATSFHSATSSLLSAPAPVPALADPLLSFAPRARPPARQRLHEASAAKIASTSTGATWPRPRTRAQSLLPPESSRGTSINPLLSPNESSFTAASSQAPSSSMWGSSKAPPDSPSTIATSPDLPSSSRASAFFAHRGGDGKHSSAFPPLLRRLQTDMTAATSLSSGTSHASKASVEAAKEVEEPSALAQERRRSEAVGSTRTTSVLSAASSSSQPNLARLANQSTVSGSSSRRFPQRKKQLDSENGVSPGNVSLTPSARGKEAAAESPAATLFQTPPARLRLGSMVEEGVSPALLTTPSPKKAKDLIRFFEQGQSPASPRTPREDTPATPASAIAQRFRSALAASNSNASSLAAEAGDELCSPPKLLFRLPAEATLGGTEADPVALKHAAMARVRPRMQRSRLGVLAGAAGSDADDENAPPGVDVSPTGPSPRRVSGLRKTSRRSSSSHDSSPLRDASATSPSRRERASAPPPGGMSGQLSDAAAPGRTEPSPTRRLGGFKSSVRNIVSAFSNKERSGGDAGGTSSSQGWGGGGGGGGRPPPSAWRESSHEHPSISRQDTAGTQGTTKTDDEGSVTTALTMGTIASYRRRSETGDLPLDTRGALELISAAQQRIPPLRQGPLYYFNVHSRVAHWQRAQAVLLPTALALSWIPAGGGRENIVLDLRACREVHSVPGPLHPSSLRDAGAIAARQQDLMVISSFQLIFDDGVERLAVDTATDRVHWVSSLWDALGIVKDEAPQKASRSVSPSDQGAPASVTQAVQILSAQSKPSQGARRKPVSTITEVSSEQTAGNLTTLSRERPLSDNTMGGATIERIGSVWKSELSSDKSERAAIPSIAAALATGPPVPPKEGPPPARLAASLQPRAPNVTSVALRDAVHSQPASVEDAVSPTTRPPQQRTLTGSTLQGQSDASDDKGISERSQSAYVSGSTFAPSEHDGDFTPLSPPSDFTWSYSDNGRELVPSDSASQRPPRSDCDGSERRFSVRSVGDSAEDAAAAHAAALRLQAETAESLSEGEPSDELAGTPVDARALAATGAVRPSVDAVLADYTGHLLDTVVEETPSQAQSFAGRSRATDRRSSGAAATRISGEIREEEEARTPSPRKLARSAKSQLSSSGRTVDSTGSQDVARLLEYLETQQTAQQAREAVLEEQIRGFQDAISNLQRKETSSSSKRSARRSSTTSTGEASLRSAARDAELAAVQDKLDRVLNLVSNVFEGQARLEREAKERGSTVLSSPSAVASPAPQDLSRIEDTLQTLLKRMQSPEQALLSGAAAQRADGLPAVLDPENRARFLELGNINMREMSSRDRAILADRLVGRGARGRSSAPAAVEADATPHSLVSQWTRSIASPGLADLGTPGMSASISDSDLLTLDDRIPPRSWVSAEGVPAPPPNTDNASLLSRDGSSRPTRDLFFGVPSSSARARPRAAFAPDASPVSLDMEVEVRRRRGRHPETAVHGGGFFTPRTASGAPQAPEKDGPVLRMARQRNASDATDHTGLGLSMPDRSKVVGRDKVGSAGSVLSAGETAPSTPSPELAAVLQAIKDNEEARAAQQKQSADIARYLNELNSWLERDVVDRSKEWRTLATGVTQLHEELALLKGGGVGMSAAAVAGTMLAGDKPHPDGQGPASAARGSRPLPTPEGPPTSLVPAGRPVAPPPAGAPPFAKGVQWAEPAGAAGLISALPISPPKGKPGTRTWHAQPSPGALRNQDVWATSGSQPKVDKAAAKRAKRRKSLSRMKRFAAAAGGAALVHVALSEWEKHKAKQRTEGKPEEGAARPDASGKYPERLEVPEHMVAELKTAAATGDEAKLREIVKKAAEAGAGGAAVAKVAEHFKQSDSADEATGDSEVDSDDTLAPSDTTARMQGDGASEARRRKRSKGSASSGGSGMEAAAGGGALALAVEEILKHLLEKKDEEQRRLDELARREAARDEAQRAAEAQRDARVLTLRERERNELVELIMGKLEAEKSSQQQTAAQAAASTDESLKALASDLLRTTSEQNGRLVEAVHAASREMLRSNVETHAEELKRVLSQQVAGMFEDVGKIREAKRALELEISDLFMLKSRHLGGVMPVAAMQMPYAAASIMPMPASPPKPASATASDVKKDGGRGALPVPGAVPWAMPMGMPMPAEAAAPPAAGGEPPKPAKRDWLSPLSFDFSPHPRK